MCRKLLQPKKKFILVGGSLLGVARGPGSLGP